MKAILLSFVIVAIMTMCFLPVLKAQGLTIDKIYTEIVAPLQHENFSLRLQIINLADQVQELQKQLKEAKEPAK